MKKRLPEVHYLLHITISTLYIVGIVVFGCLLGWYNYRKASDILLSSTDQIYNQLRRELSLDYLASCQPVSQAISILAHHEIVTSVELEERLSFLPQFRAALGINLVAGVVPYLFYFFQEMGYTLSYKSSGRGAVVAWDITLGELSRRISARKVVAYRDSAKLLINKNWGRSQGCQIDCAHPRQRGLFA